MTSVDGLRWNRIPIQISFLAVLFYFSYIRHNILYPKFIFLFLALYLLRYI
jgi:hypothetical protein